MKEPGRHSWEANSQGLGTTTENVLSVLPSNGSPVNAGKLRMSTPHLQISMPGQVQAGGPSCLLHSLYRPMN